MNLKYRERQILQLLLIKKAITGNEFSEIFNVSTRTIRNDIRKINQLLSTYNIEISSSNYLGYYIDINENQKAELEEIINTPNYISSGEPIYREKYLIFEFLKSNTIDIVDVSERLYASESTVVSDLKRLELKMFTIDREFIFNKRNSRYCISRNNEKHIRMYFSLILVERFSEFDLVLNEKIFGLNIDFNKLKTLAVDALASKQIVLTDQDLRFLYVFLLVSIIRNKSNYIINSTELMNSNPLVSIIIEEIAEKIQGEYRVYLKFEEKILLNELFNSFNKMNRTNTKNAHLYNIIVEQCIKIDKFYGTSFSSDTQFLESLTAHVESYIYKKSLNINFSETIIKQIKELYPFAHHLAIHLKKLTVNNNIFKQIEFDENELAFLSVHIQTSIERNMYRKKLNAIVVCSYGISTAMLLETQLKKEFKHINIVATISSFAYELVDKKSIDIIITTAPIADQDTSIPIVEVEVPLTLNCIDSISIALSSKYYWIKKMYPLIIELPEGICNEKQCIMYMSDFLNYVENKDYNFSERLLNREQLLTTNIGRDIAMPHALIENELEYCVYFFKSKNYIRWGSSTVKLVICILINEEIKEYMNEYMKVVNGIYEKICIDEIESVSVAKLINTI